uniref:Biopterin-dependent aromatic amino acid hydroxylase family profile domain-containing protein n=1 Tax=Globodera rostochiensis TaxID=31243 RepID=A0A914I7R2_GLORO
MSTSRGSASGKSGGDRSLPFGRRDSLIKQASLDRVQNEGLRRQNTILETSGNLIKPWGAFQKSLSLCIFTFSLLQRLNDDGIELIRAASDERAMHLVISLHCSGDSRDVLQSALAKFSFIGLHLGHLETRPDLAHPGELEIRAQLGGKKVQFLDALTKLVKEKDIERIELRHFVGRIEGEEGNDKVQKVEGGASGPDPTETVNRRLISTVWFPLHVSELDQSNHVLVKYEPTEDPKHPGFGDQPYIARRAELNALANDEENNTWRKAYEQLKELRETHTCEEYQQNIAEMERAGLITSDRIPQLRQLSAYIQRKTGFELRPCGGLLSARDFLASLAFRIFQATLYVRHASAPHHCPEPDVIHEVLGHCPMFADEHLAQMSQEIGLLALGATDEQIERLATVYWFIIEFGLCRQKGQLRAIGAGLLSAFGELKYACSDGPGHELFEPEVTALRPYADSDYQPVYFVAESIQKAMDSVRAYARSISSKACQPALWSNAE